MYQGRGLFSNNPLRQASQHHCCVLLPRSCVLCAPAMATKIATMRTLKPHPNMLKLHGVFEDEEGFHVVLEFCKGAALLEQIHNRVRGHSTGRRPHSRGCWVAAIHTATQPGQPSVGGWWGAGVEQQQAVALGHLMGTHLVLGSMAARGMPPATCSAQHVVACCAGCWLLPASCRSAGSLQRA